MAFNPGSRSRSQLAQPMAEINTTPMVDVMLVLLVIFIITAPLLNQAIPIDLPRVASAPLETPPATIAVAIDADGVVRLERDPVALVELADALRARAREHATPPEIHLRADRATRYERVAEVMASVRRAGLDRIAFVTEAPSVEPDGGSARAATRVAPDASRAGAPAAVLAPAPADAPRVGAESPAMATP